jgi:hypothetical protein
MMSACACKTRAKAKELCAIFYSDLLKGKHRMKGLASHGIIGIVAVFVDIVLKLGSHEGRVN